MSRFIRIFSLLVVPVFSVIILSTSIFAITAGLNSRPVPVRTMYLNSDLVFTGTVVQTGQWEIVAKNSAGITYRRVLTVNVESPIKGAAAGEIAVTEFRENGEASNFVAGQRRLFFLAAAKNSYFLLSNFHGDLLLNERALGVYVERLGQLQNIYLSGGKTDEQVMDWLAELAADPVTRFDGAYDLQLITEGGVFIDPLGRPSTESDEGNGLDPHGRGIACGGDYTACIDPNGKSSAYAKDEGWGMDPNGKGLGVDPNGKPSAYGKDDGRGIDPNGRGYGMDPNGKPSAYGKDDGRGIDPNGKGLGVDPNGSSPAGQNPDGGPVMDPNGKGMGLDPNGKCAGDYTACVDPNGKKGTRSAVTNGAKTEGEFPWQLSQKTERSAGAKSVEIQKGEGAWPWQLSGGPNGRGSTIDPSGAGSAMDPNGGGGAMDPNGKGPLIDPNGRDAGVIIDPNGRGAGLDPNGRSEGDTGDVGPRMDANGRGLGIDPNGKLPSGTATESGTSIDPSGRDSGTSLDPSGRDSGTSLDPSGRALSAANREKLVQAFLAANFSGGLLSDGDLALISVVSTFHDSRVNAKLVQFYRLVFPGAGPSAEEWDSDVVKRGAFQTQRAVDEWVGEVIK